jgi:hypothetical protein
MVLKADFEFKGYRGHFILENGFIVLLDRNVKADAPGIVINGFEGKDKEFEKLIGIDTNSAEKIVDFYNSYGALNYQSFAFSHQRESIEDAKYRIECFQIVFKLIFEIRKSNISKIGQLLLRLFKIIRYVPELGANARIKSGNPFEEDDYLKNTITDFIDLWKETGGFIFNFDKDESGFYKIANDFVNSSDEIISLFASFVAEFVINEYIKDVHPTIAIRYSDIKGRWKASKPICAIYYEFYLLICRGDTYEICAYEKCRNKRYFNINERKKGAIYCSKDCADAAAVDAYKSSDKYKAAQAAKKAAKKVGEKHGTDN